MGSFKKSLGLLLILISTSLTTVPIATVRSQSTNDWPMPQHDPANTGYSSSAVIVNPTLIWTFPNPKISHVKVDHTTVDTTPVIADGYLYITNANGSVGFYCLNASTGEALWSSSLAAGSSVVSVSDGILYVDIDARIAALNASTGALIWNVTTQNSIMYGGVIANDVLYTQSNATFYAVNLSTRTQIWTYTFPNNGSIGWLSAAADGHIYGTYSINNSYSCIISLNASNGRELWRYKTSNDHSNLIVNNDMLYIGVDNNVYALNASTGTVLWNYPTGETVRSLAVDNNRVYMGSWDSNFYALNATTGAKLWSFNIGHPVQSTPAVDNGVVYVNSNDLYLRAFNVSTGALLWKYLTISSDDPNAGNGGLASPAIAEGKIYIGTSEGNVLAFSTQSENNYSVNIFPIAVGVFVAVIVVIFIVCYKKKKQNRLLH